MSHTKRRPAGTADLFAEHDLRLVEEVHELALRSRQLAPSKEEDEEERKERNSVSAAVVSRRNAESAIYAARSAGRDPHHLDPPRRLVHDPHPLRFRELDPIAYFKDLVVRAREEEPRLRVRLNVDSINEEFWSSALNPAERRSGKPEYRNSRGEVPVLLNFMSV